MYWVIVFKNNTTLKGQGLTCNQYLKAFDNISYVEFRETLLSPKIRITIPCELRKRHQIALSFNQVQQHQEYYVIYFPDLQCEIIFQDFIMQIQKAK